MTGPLLFADFHRQHGNEELAFIRALQDTQETILQYPYFLNKRCRKDMLSICTKKEIQQMSLGSNQEDLWKAVYLSFVSPLDQNSDPKYKTQLNGEIMLVWL